MSSLIEKEKEYQYVLNEFITYYYNIKNQCEIYNQILDNHNELINKKEFTIYSINHSYNMILKKILNKCIAYVMLHNLDFSLLGSFYDKNKEDIENIRAEIILNNNITFLTHTTEY